MDSVYRALESKGRPSWLRRLGTYVPHTLISDREAVHHHYDLGNDFYRLWLDDRMLYSCAYFEDPTQSLEAAQIAKMDHVCRKLGLRAGEKVIEAGCGWGSLALHMAKHYGVRVRAFNVSTEQIAWAKERAERARLTGRVEFVQRDYRDIDGPCDAFVSVGMLEHVGRGSYRELGAVLRREPSTGRTDAACFTSSDAIDRRRSIRGSESAFSRAPIRRPWTRFSAVSSIPAEMSVIDVENLRAHYALTLEHWRTRYESAVGCRPREVRRTDFAACGGSIWRDRSRRSGRAGSSCSRSSSRRRDRKRFRGRAMRSTAEDEGLTWNEPTS